MSIAAIALVALAQVKPGPLDAFRANYAEIKVDVDYFYEWGTLDAAARDGRLWTGQDVAFVAKPERTIEGHWGCDGQVESYAFSSPAEVIKAAWGQPITRVRGVGNTGMMVGVKMPFVPETEALFDGKILAGHQENDASSPFSNDTIYVWANGNPGYASDGSGPFRYWGTYAFPQFLEVHLPGVAPTRRTSARGGHPTEVEVYKKIQSPTEWLQVEVHYDPSIGYLPRYTRKITYSSRIPTFVTESYLIEALPCAAGGYVPTEWYCLKFGIRDFGSKYPEYDEETDVPSPGQRVNAGHFKVTSLVDRTTPVALTRLKDIHWIATAGGKAAVGPATASLTLGSIKARLGTKLTNPAPRPKLPTLDAAELSEFGRPPEPTWTWTSSLVLSLVAALLLASLVAWRRHRALVLLAGLLVLPGCSRPAEPVSKLGAASSQPRLLCDLGAPDLAMTLVVRNEGDRPSRLFKADDG